MTCYVISYDLPEDSDYEPLIDAIKAYDNWAHITESTWAVVTSKSATDIREDLNQYANDGRIIVVSSGNGAAWRNVLCTNEWLKENL